MVWGLGSLEELNGLGSGFLELTVFKSHKKPSSLVFVPSLFLVRHGLSGILDQFELKRNHVDWKLVDWRLIPFNCL